jgi:hypothetical protein
VSAVEQAAPKPGTVTSRRSRFPVRWKHVRKDHMDRSSLRSKWLFYQFRRPALNPVQHRSCSEGLVGQLALDLAMVRARRKRHLFPTL